MSVRFLLTMIDEEQIPSCWILVIDTDSYSGNFERELTAYLTGQLGECGVGDRLAELFKTETKTDKPPVKFEDMVLSVSDERGCYRPCSIYPTPGWYNDGMGGHYKAGDEDNALKTYQKTVETDVNKEKARYEGYLKNMPTGWTEKDVRRQLKAIEKRLDDAKKLKKVSKFPAYQSVAIFFSKKPSEKTIAWLKTRAEGYDKARKTAYDWDRGPGPKILGWRLVNHQVSVKDDEEKV